MGESLASGLVTCDGCDRVSVGVSQTYAEDEVHAFNQYFATLTPDQKENYNNQGASVDSYVCLGCGGRNFHPASDADVDRAAGHTINPVVVDKLTVSEVTL